MSENTTSGEETVAVEYRGRTYTLPADPQDWPVSAVRAAENGRMANACALLMGSIGVDVDDWTGRRLNALFEQYAQTAGFEDSGE